MQLSFENLGIGLGVVCAGVIAWFGAIWLNLEGGDVWVFRIAVFLVLLLILGAVVLWLRKRSSEQARNASSPATSGEGTEGSFLSDDVLTNLREAEAKVAASPRVPRGTKLSSLPVIFVLGESSSGKSSVVLNSGLEPELLSGQVFQDGGLAPTRLANIWFARKIIFLEIGGKFLGDVRLWHKILRRLSPSKFAGLFGRGIRAPRAAVVCVDSEKFVKATQPDELTASARATRARLEQISSQLGISLPVYVVFARTDQVHFFDDYFHNLAGDEPTQVLGTTLPVAPLGAGVYQEQESKRLNNALTAIFQSLSECRTGLLYREQATERLGGIYEFPREFQKRIPLMAQYLVDLGRPSQLTTSHFLRGFYFTGIRLVEESLPGGGGATVLQQSSGFDVQKTRFSAGATSLMKVDEVPPKSGWQAQTMPMGDSSSSRKTKQWLFLSHVFSHVILEDRAALGVSGSSTQSNLAKKVLYATLSLIALVLLLGTTISFFSNRDLEARVRVAADGISSIQSTNIGLASPSDLKRLDDARQVLEELNGYKRDHKPLHLRWGLYAGDHLYDEFRPFYFDRFKKLLFGDVQTRMARFLMDRPPSPTNPTDDDYTQSYDTLKAYLMTTLNPEKSDSSFLAQFLLSKWVSLQDSEEQKRLALDQFNFYADELRIDNPFPSKDNPIVADAVGKGRNYLRAFSGPTLVYRGYLAKLRQDCKQCQALNFAKQYPDASKVIHENEIVDGAFTKNGWDYMRVLISRNEWNNTDDEWVLGPGARQSPSGNVNSNDVQSVYQADYIRVWRAFVKSASVSGLGGPSDASNKLNLLSGNRSPLLQLLCEVSENTSGTSVEIAKAFQSVTDVVKAPCRDQVLQDSSKSYVQSLSNFQLCIDQFQEKPDGPPTTQRDDNYKACRKQFQPLVQRDAKIVVKSEDREAALDKCVLNLLNLAGCSPGQSTPPPAIVSDAFCSAVNGLSSKYPFNPNSTEKATLEEFQDFFQPGGTLSKELAKGGATGNRARLLSFARSVQKSLYPNGYHFLITATVPPGMKTLQLKLDGVVLNVMEGSPKPQAFNWPGSKPGAELLVGGSSTLSYGGPWALFSLFANYHWPPGNGGVYHLVSNTLNSPQGISFTDTLDFQAEGVPLFRPGYLAQLRCH